MFLSQHSPFSNISVPVMTLALLLRVGFLFRFEGLAKVLAEQVPHTGILKNLLLHMEQVSSE